MMIAFFTTIGLGASLSLLKVGGPQVLLFWGLASLLAVLQNAVGIALAKGLDVHPFLGLIAGSITMTGGHGTGAAFGKLMEDQYAFSAGVTLAMAAATFGLVSGGLIGGPVATTLIKRFHPAHRAPGAPSAASAKAAEYQSLDTEIDKEPAGSEATAYTLLKIIMVILATMWAGGLLSQWLGQYVTLPAYIGAMIVAAIVRNTTDVFPSLKLEQRTIDDLGTIALSLFLAMALMSLRLWELLDLALPMLVILTAQVTMMAAFAYFVTFRFMGRDYDAAVMAGGHCGFGLGATPNAVANMEAIVERFGPAPRAFLVAADGRRVLHRLHQRHDHHGVHQLGEVGHYGMSVEPFDRRPTNLTGEWAGENRLWLSPDQPARVSETTATITTAARDQGLLVHYTWEDEGAPQAGVILVQYTRKGVVTAAWTDAWHMSGTVMFCRGAIDGKGQIVVDGSYAAPPGPDWGWRIGLEPAGDDGFILRMFNMTPEGEIHPAVEARYTRKRA